MFSGIINICSKILENTHVVYVGKRLEVIWYLIGIANIRFTRNVAAFRVDLKFVLDYCGWCVGLCRTDDSRPEKSAMLWNHNMSQVWLWTNKNHNNHNVTWIIFKIGILEVHYFMVVSVGLYFGMKFSVVSGMNELCWGGWGALNKMRKWLFPLNIYH